MQGFGSIEKAYGTSLKSTLETKTQEEVQVDLEPVSLIQTNAILEAIAECESGRKQFYQNGEVVRGKVDNDDVGKFQINQRIHAKEIQRLGIDIYTEEGNTAFAIHLFNLQGTKPWSASSKCWELTK